MSFLLPVQCSSAWYRFASETAVNDEEVQRLAQDYIQAMNKLNARLTELAKADPSAPSLTAHSGDGNDNSDISPDFLEAARSFHEFHGASYTDGELTADARRHGLTTFALAG